MRSKCQNVMYKKLSVTLLTESIKDMHQSQCYSTLTTLILNQKKSNTELVDYSHSILKQKKKKIYYFLKSFFRRFGAFPLVKNEILTSCVHIQFNYVS